MDELRPTLVRSTCWRLAGILAILACAPVDAAPGQPLVVFADGAGSVARATPGESVIGQRPKSIAESLAMFRERLDVPSGLTGGASTRDALIRRFVRAVEQRDTAAVRAMVLDRAEFAWLYYPSSPYTRPPSAQEAPLTWFLLVENSQKGVTRAFNRLGGSRIEYRSHRCDPTPAPEGDNLVWRNCVVELRTSDGAMVTRRLFGSIIERGGQLKFLSYANDF